MTQSEKRPNGVSGLMRVKDEEEYVEASIDSVIDALDELIICYQKCTDRTPEILERKQREYPDKIKLYYYAPKVYSHNLTPEEYAYACSLPGDSPYLLSGYYNYTLSKATYRYAVKIDADQVYFTERMQEICDAYRSDKQEKLTILEGLALRCFYLGQGWKACLKKAFACLLSLAAPFEVFYRKGVLKQVASRKMILWISGINLYKQKDTYWTYCDKDYNFYNGFYDHCFFEITEDTYYWTYKEHDMDYNGQPVGSFLIERFHFETTMNQKHFGFCWYHMRTCKKENLLEFEFQGTTVDQLKQLDGNWLKRNNYLSNSILPNFMFFHRYDRSYPLPEDLKI